MTLTLQIVRFPGADAEGQPIGLVSQAAYHLDELIPLGRALGRLGYAPTLHLTEGAPGPAQRFRAQHRRFLRSKDRLTHFGMRLAGERVEAIGPVRALVTMSDWGITRPLIETARARGATTFAKVEGAQDFADTNTGRTRGAYRTAEVILCQGTNDYEALTDTTRHIVGNSRIETLLAAPPVDHLGPIVINSNFSYGVLTEHRKQWVLDAIAACRAANRDFVISQHPADRSLVGVRHRSRESVETLLDTAAGLITRFSSLGFSALARGVPLHYFNPHGENTGAFAEPMGAFAIANSVDELITRLNTPSGSPAAVRSTARAFLANQVDVGDTESASRAAEIIDSVLRS